MYDPKLHDADDGQVLENVMAKLGLDPVRPARRKRPVTADIEKAWSLPGFSGKARVMTSFGNMPLEGLRVRDTVRTQSGRFLPVKWIDTLRLDEDFLDKHPAANPVSLMRGSLDQGVPEVDILVSPAQPIRAPRRFSPVPVTPAQSLIGRCNVMRKPQPGFTYYLFHCGEPVTVCIDGLWCDVAPK